MGALLGIGSSIVGGLLSKSSGNQQADDLRAAGEAGAARFEPFESAGAGANQQILDALSGGEGATNAFQNFQNSTGFQSQLAAGSQAITGNQASRGLLNSGSTLKRQTKFGSDLAAGGFSDFLGQLGNVANRGVAGAQGASNALVGANTNAANAAAEGRGGFQAGLGAAVQQIPGFG